MKCPRCGKEMYSLVSTGSDTARGNYIDTKYVCPGCGCEVKTTTDGNGMGMIRNFVPEYHYGDYGWICPKCGAVLSPSTTECPHCTPYKTTCGPTSGFPIQAELTNSVDGISVGDNIDVTATAQTLRKR